MSANSFKSSLEEAWDIAIKEYEKGRRFHKEEEIRDFLYDHLVSQFGSTIVRKEEKIEHRQPDIVIREDERNGIAVEIKCSVYDIGSVFKKDVKRDLEKLVSYINEGFTYSYFLWFAEFEYQRKVEDIENRIKHIQTRCPQLYYKVFKPCSKMNFALGYDEKDPECILCPYVEQCKRFKK